MRMTVRRVRIDGHLFLDILIVVVVVVGLHLAAEHNVVERVFTRRSVVGVSMVAIEAVTVSGCAVVSMAVTLFVCDDRFVIVHVASIGPVAVRVLTIVIVRVHVHAVNSYHWSRGPLRSVHQRRTENARRHPKLHHVYTVHSQCQLILFTLALSAFRLRCLQPKPASRVRVASKW